MTLTPPELERIDSSTLDPPNDYPAYRSTELRAPKRPLYRLSISDSEITGPVFGSDAVLLSDADLTIQHPGRPIGERIVVSGRVTDRGGHPVRDQLVEIWQTNTAGRYAHKVDDHDAPLDPNFTGQGRCLTDGEGTYRFVTIRPGSYPWANHEKAFRPAHIHFSVFGTAFTSRLVTQMYFPNDPLFALDPIFHAVRDEAARQTMISSFDLSLTVADFALGYRFDIVLDGPRATVNFDPTR